MPKPDIHRLIKLQALLLKFRDIKRMIYIPSNLKERENDVEHSYNLAMAGWFLAKDFPELDRDKIIRIALAHDLVEVYAGDTFAFADASVLAGKKDREQAALEQLKNEWTDFSELFDDIEEYEKRETAEAKFVYALDTLMPAVINYLSDGYVYIKPGITFETFQEMKKKRIPISPEVYEYYKQLLDIFKKNPNKFFPPSDQ